MHSIGSVTIRFERCRHIETEAAQAYHEMGVEDSVTYNGCFFLVALLRVMTLLSSSRRRKADKILKMAEGVGEPVVHSRFVAGSANALQTRMQRAR